MPIYGISCGPDKSQVVAEAGFDFIEWNVQAWLRGTEPDEAVDVVGSAAASALPILAANCLLPGNLKVVGPDRDLPALEAYMENVLRRAGQTHAKQLVFGSGGARAVPDSFDRDAAPGQILTFLEMVAPIAQKHGVTVVIEPLRREECNILNTVEETMAYVDELDDPAVQCLVDSYHLWSVGESEVSIVNAGKHLRHVHVADLNGRTAPGESGDVAADYRRFFGALKQIGYDDKITIEGDVTYEPEPLQRTLIFMKTQWDAA